MCDKCYQLVCKYYPNLSDADRGEVLMGATAFPHCSPKYLEKQLKELIDNTDGSLDAALYYADFQLQKEFHKYRIFENALWC